MSAAAEVKLIYFFAEVIKKLVVLAVLFKNIFQYFSMLWLFAKCTIMPPTSKLKLALPKICLLNRTKERERKD